MSASDERLLSLEDVADRLQVSDQSVRRWIKAGKLAAYKPGLEWRISPSDLEDFLETRSYPKVQAPLPSDDLQAGRRSSRFAEAIAAAAERWGEAMASTDVNDHKRFGLIDAALDLADRISGTVPGEEDWEAIPNQERLEIVTTLEKLNETANLGIAHLKESEEAKAKEKQANQRREQIREWTRRIGA